MTLTLSIIALISAILTIYAKLRENELLQFIFKPLTLLAIILLVYLNSSAPMNFYQMAVLAGLIFSLIGDVLLIRQDRYFVQGLIAFLLGHLCYIAAFWTDPNLLSGLFYLIYVIFFLRLLWPGLGKLKVPVIVYAVVIATMGWMALSLTINHHDHHTFHAFLGSVVFIVSDSLLAFNKFKTKISLGPFWILATYFLAQWLIALSV
jgi:uncharacterized membrane protein YhhN